VTNATPETKDFRRNFHWHVARTTADYPHDLFTVLDPPPENGDGQPGGRPDK
jgi:hypothetical protein